MGFHEISCSGSISCHFMRPLLALFVKSTFLRSSAQARRQKHFRSSLKV